MPLSHLGAIECQQVIVGENLNTVVVSVGRIGVREGKAKTGKKWAEKKRDVIPFDGAEKKSIERVG